MSRLSFSILAISALRLQGLLVGEAFSNRPKHARRNVLHRRQDVYFQVRALQLLALAARMKTIGDVVLLGRRYFLQLARRHVMIGQKQAARAYKRAGPAVIEAHAGQADMVEPLLRRGKSVTLLELFERHVVKRPHAFVGNARRGQRNQKE